MKGLITILIMAMLLKMIHRVWDGQNVTDMPFCRRIQ